jgi:predicted RNase H-like HicB family nuclease
VKVRGLVRLLESNGWQLKGTRGSHRQFRHPTKGIVVTVRGQLGRKARGLITYTVIYERGPASWGAYVPDLPGVITVGDSRQEVERLIQEAIAFHIEGLREKGLPIPTPASFAGSIEINSAA